MISTLRKNFKTRFYKAVLWITILATGGVFSAFELVRLFFGSETKKWVVTVNGKAIDYGVFTRKVVDEQERMRALRAQYGAYADLLMQLMHASSDPKVAAIDSAIRESLLNQAAGSLSLSISPEYSADKLRDMMFLQKELSDVVPLFVLEAPGVINLRSLRVYLQRSGISTEQFDELVEQAIKRHLLAELVSSADYIPSFEVERLFRKDHVAKKYSYMHITLDQMRAEVKKEGATDAQLKAFYDRQNASRHYAIPEKRSAKLWTFDAKEFGIAIPEQDIEEYYQKNKARQFVQTPAQVQVRRILLRVEDPSQAGVVREKADKLRTELMKSPALFAQKAKEVSEDKETASQGGQLPYFSKGAREEAFERAAFVLKADLDISPVVSTSQGFELLQRTGRKNVVYKPLSAVKGEIQNTLLKERFGREFSMQARQAISKGNAGIVALVQSKHAKEKEVKDIINNNTLLARTLFKLKEGETTYYQEGTEGVIITAGAGKPSELPSLEAVRDQVKNDYYTEKAHKALDAALQKWTQKAKEGALSGPGVVSAGWLKKGDTSQISVLEKQGVPVQKLLQLETTGSVSSAEVKGGGYVMRVDEIGAFDKALFEQEKSKIRAEASKERSNLIMAGFVASLWRSATIEKNDTLLHREM